MHFKITELAFVQHFWSNIEKPHVNRNMVKLSKFTSFTVFGAVVNRYISFSELFAVRDLSVSTDIYVFMCSMKLTHINDYN